MNGGAWWAAVHGVTRSRTRLSDFTFTFHFHALEEEMATHSSVLLKDMIWRQLSMKTRQLLEWYNRKPIATVGEMSGTEENYERNSKFWQRTRPWASVIRDYLKHETEMKAVMDKKYNRVATMVQKNERCHEQDCCWTPQWMWGEAIGFQVNGWQQWNLEDFSTGWNEDLL